MGNLSFQIKERLLVRKTVKKKVKIVVTAWLAFSLDTMALMLHGELPFEVCQRRQPGKVTCPKLQVPYINNY